MSNHPAKPNKEAILQIADLRTYFQMEGGIAKAVDGVSYEVFQGQTLSVVGESGSGKSVTALSIMGLIPTPPGIKAGGEVRFKGKDLIKASNAEMRKIRGNDIAMIFQEPMTSLNPVFTVGDQIGEALRLHKGMNKATAHDASIEMLKRVGIPRPDIRVDEYPHQMSGGMRQRVMIAMALSCDPELLIADEPTTALDVTIQAQILELMEQLQEDFGASILFITHDLGVVAEVSDHVAVMYAGKVVEYADVYTLYDTPQHPYTVGLFNSLPDVSKRTNHNKRLSVIPGIVPSPLDFPSGCRFRNRCPIANERCSLEEPNLRTVGSGHTVACHAVEEGRHAAAWEANPANQAAPPSDEPPATTSTEDDRPTLMPQFEETTDRFLHAPKDLSDTPTVRIRRPRTSDESPDDDAAVFADDDVSDEHGDDA